MSSASSRDKTEHGLSEGLGVSVHGDW
jgi:hypothetical protein